MNDISLTTRVNIVLIQTDTHLEKRKNDIWKKLSGCHVDSWRFDHFPALGDIHLRFHRTTTRSNVIKFFKLKTIYKCFLSLLKPELNAMLHRIHISKNTCEITMQLKRAKGKATFPYYQYITNSCAFVESPHYFAWIVVCFPIVVIALLHGFDI